MQLAWQSVRSRRGDTMRRTQPTTPVSGSHASVHARTPAAADGPFGGTARPSAPVAEALEARRLLSAGDLDPAFGSGGRAILDLPGAPGGAAGNVTVYDVKAA